MQHFQRFSASQQTIKAQLFDHERIIQDKDGVGLYDGKERSEAFDNGRLYLTNHRLIYLDAAEPYRNSRYLDLSVVKQTEYWVGFMASSPKITLVLAEKTQRVEETMQDSLDVEGLHPSSQSWTCHVCGYRNNASKGNKCSLCGVFRSKTSTPAPSAMQSQSSTPSQSTPPSRPESPAPSPTSSNGLITCPACTYLNHPSMLKCEICDTSLASLLPRARRVSTSSQKRPSTPTAIPGTPTFIKLSFRKGGVQPFYAALKMALQAKEWDQSNGTRSSTFNNKTAQNDSVGEHTLAVYGINGILKTIDVDARDREDDMQEALGDLNALMKRAQDMVRMAETLNAKLASSDDRTDENAVQAVTRSLKSLGLDTPVVAKAGELEEEQYHKGLAKELGTVLLGRTPGAANTSTAPMAVGDPQREIIGLDQVWCLWNRARGVALVSPQDLRSATRYLPEFTRPQIKLQIFKTGLNVLYLPNFGRETFSLRIVETLSASEDRIVFGLPTLDIARQEGISVLLTNQLLELVEDSDSPPIVRDEGDVRSGTRWQPNLFAELERWKA